MKILGLRLRGKYKKYDISKEEALKLLEDDATKVLDVRTSKEMAKEDPIVEDAVSIDYQESNFKERVAELPRDGVYLVVCTGGIKGRGACEIMEGLGFKRVYNLKGGLRAYNSCDT